MIAELLKLWDFDSDEKAIIKDILSQNESNFFWLLGGVFSWVEREIGEKISHELKIKDIARLDCSNIADYIDNLVNDIVSPLQERKIFHSQFIKNNLRPSITYRLYVYWIIQILKKTGFELEKKNFLDVPNELAREIYNIFQDKALTTFFVVLKSFWVLDYTVNPVNEYEKEKEMKILEVDKDGVMYNLDCLGADRIFCGEVEDVYFDYYDLRLDRQGKRSFRIRRKLSDEKEEYFYTIKRKITIAKPWKPRICYEKEFAIHHFDIFEKVLESFWLLKSRKKVKSRCGYTLSHIDEETWDVRKIKFDIDTYQGIPNLLEIECDYNSDIVHYIKALNLQKNKTLSSGSRGLFRHYGKYDEYTHYYMEDKEGNIIWW